MLESLCLEEQKFVITVLVVAQIDVLGVRAVCRFNFPSKTNVWSGRLLGSNGTSLVPELLW